MESGHRVMFGLAFLMVYFSLVEAVVFQRTRGNTSAGQRANRCSPEELQAKDLDVVLFGATGYLGRTVAHYMADRRDMVPWAMAGRDIANLRQVNQMLMQEVGTHGAKLLVADYDKKLTLHAITKRAKVILNTAGPFEKLHASNLINASIQNCAHYVDVAGETHWRSEILKKYGQLAADRGLVITQGAGYVSLLADWLALTTARTVAGDGKGPPSDVWNVFTKMNGAPGAGSVESATYAFAKYGPVSNPYILSPETPKAARVDLELDGVEDYEHHPGINMNLGVYSGSRMDCPVVRRSMQLEFPDVPIRVHEAQDESLYENLKTYMFDHRMFTHPPTMTLDPHVGPPRWMLEAGSFAAHGWAFRKSDGRVAHVTIEGQQDPAYLGTARMTSELVIALATSGPYKGKVGYLSPAQVIDTTELEHRWTSVDNGAWVKITHFGRTNPNLKTRRPAWRNGRGAGRV